MKFYDKESIYNLEKVLLEASERGVKDYLVKKLQDECTKEMLSAGYQNITLEIIDKYQKKIDMVNEFGVIGTMI